MRTFKQFIEEKKKIKFVLNTGGELETIGCDSKKKKKGGKKELELKNNIEGEPVAIGESIEPWILDGKYKQALEKLQGSKFYRFGPLPKNISLSASQLPTIFGNEVEALMKMGIIKRIESDAGPFGGSSTSYTLVNPVK